MTKSTARKSTTSKIVKTGKKAAPAKAAKRTRKAL